MIPSNFQRAPRGGRGNIPLPLVLAGVVVFVIVGVFAWVALTMGSVPATESVSADVPVTL